MTRTDMTSTDQTSTDQTDRSEGATMEQAGVALTETAWALQNKINPFPVGGQLTWDGERLRFTLGALAGEAALGWVEDRLGVEGLGDRLRSGESVDAVSVGREELRVSWPAMYAGSALEITDQADRTWLICLDYPSGGSISQTMSLFSGRKKGKAWKKAFGS